MKVLRCWTIYEMLCTSLLIFQQQHHDLQQKKVCNDEVDAVLIVPLNELQHHPARQGCFLIPLLQKLLLLILYCQSQDKGFWLGPSAKFKVQI